MSLGSNIGDTKANLKQAVAMLKEKIDVLKISSYYETEPVGYKDQAWFLNIALEGETTLSPTELLLFLQGIEQEMGRVKLIRFGPRNIDIDILLYEGFASDEETLTVPHPRMCERAFVIEPLVEIAPELTVGGTPLKQIRDSLKGEQIRRLP